MSQTIVCSIQLANRMINYDSRHAHLPQHKLFKCSLHKLIKQHRVQNEEDWTEKECSHIRNIIWFLIGDPPHVCSTFWTCVVRVWEKHMACATFELCFAFSCCCYYPTFRALSLTYYWCLHNCSTNGSCKYIGKFDWKIYVVTSSFKQLHTDKIHHIWRKGLFMRIVVLFDVAASIDVWSDSDALIYQIVTKRDTISRSNVI